MKKIGFVASSGGHWEELMCLKQIAEENQVFYVTEEGGQALEATGKKIYLMKQTNRYDKMILFRMIALFFRSLCIIWKEKPDAVITTGALIAFPFCVLMKIFRKKVIYIESFARVNDKSLTGRLVYPFADLFLVQWETMLECYPKAKYVGSIF